ncbi:MAG TPA: DinB family protein [Acidobacteriaceae bacterium]
MSPDIESLQAQLRSASEEAGSLAAGLTDEQAARRPSPDSWSVSECLDHLAITNRAYLAALTTASDRARAQGRLRRRPALPGWLASVFLRQLEPPVRPGRKIRAPKSIQPRQGLPLAEAHAEFLSSQKLVHAFLEANADLDLAGIRFVNPFVPGVRFSVASGLHIIVAHERRHLWQARQVLQAAEL